MAINSDISKIKFLHNPFLSDVRFLSDGHMCGHDPISV